VFHQTGKLVFAARPRCTQRTGEIRSSNLVNNPPQTNPYSTLKQAILSKFTESEMMRLDRLATGIQLGDGRPIHLLSQLQQTNATNDESIVRRYWIKAVFLYDYLDSFKNLEDTELPGIESFYNCLSGENFSIYDYNFAQKCWKTLNCNTIRDCLKHNLESDV